MNALMTKELNEWMMQEKGELFLFLPSVIKHHKYLSHAILSMQ
jgi:hypothetical protein